MIVGTDFARYFSDTKRLRTSLRVNELDYEFASKEGNSIIYFVDANIVGMFTNPQANKKYLSVFENWLDSDVLVSTVTLTAEFMFSGKLPGQNNNPIMMTPDHYDDLYSMAGAIKRKGASLGDQVTESETVIVRQREKERNEVIEAYKKGAIKADLFLKQLGDLLPKAILQMIHGPVAEARQLKRLIESDLLIRADTTHWFDHNILEPNPALVAEWVLRIRRFVNIKRSATNLLRDARSLVQLIELNNTSPSNTKFVFITTDSALRNAYFVFREEMRIAGRKPFPTNFFRRPREFAPLLNLTAMSGHDEFVELFPRIKKALDQLLIGISYREPVPESEQNEKKEIEASPAYIGGTSGIKGFGRNFSLENQIDNIQKLWSSAAKMALTLNSEYIVRREEAHLTSIQEVLSASDVVAAGLHQLKDTINQLSNVHIRFAYSGVVFQFLTKARARAKSEPRFRARRAPLQLKNELFPQITDRLSINNYLDKIYWHEVEPPSLEKLLSIENMGLSFLFASCVAIVAEDWRSANSFAEHAFNLIAGSEPLNADALDEARYCRALAIRFVMKSKTELEIAKQLLAESIKFSEERKDPLGQLRGTAEIASLLCIFFFRAALVVPEVEKKDFEPINFDALWKECLDCLETAESILSDEPSDIESKDRRFYQRVELQIYAIRAALAIYWHWLSPKSGQISELDRSKQRTDLKKLVAAIEEWNRISPMHDAPYTAQVFAGVMEFILAQTVEQKGKAREDAERLITKLLKYDKQLLDFDRAEYELFVSRLSISDPII